MRTIDDLVKERDAMIQDNLDPVRQRIERIGISLAKEKRKRKSVKRDAEILRLEEEARDAQCRLFDITKALTGLELDIAAVTKEAARDPKFWAADTYTMEIDLQALDMVTSQRRQRGLIAACQIALEKPVTEVLRESDLEVLLEYDLIPTSSEPRHVIAARKLINDWREEMTRLTIFAMNKRAELMQRIAEEERNTYCQHYELAHRFGNPPIRGFHQCMLQRNHVGDHELSAWQAGVPSPVS